MSLGKIKHEVVNKIDDRSFQIELQYLFMGSEKLFFPPNTKSVLSVSERDLKIPIFESERNIADFTNKSLCLQWELINHIYIFDNERKDTAADSLSSLNNIYIIIEPTTKGLTNGLTFLEQKCFPKHLESLKSRFECNYSPSDCTVSGTIPFQY